MSDEFGDRMKNYEAASDFRLTARLPVILRLDGNSFSKFTKNCKFEKPFDQRMFDCMWAAAEEVMKYCSGSQVAYTQSDEITILLRNDQTIQTDPFLSNRIQKISSLCASKASVAFNRKLRSFKDIRCDEDAVFDCRVFVVPKEEVNNVFLWRQNDAYKNFVSSYSYYKLGEKYGKKTAFKMIDGKNTSKKIDMMFEEFGVLLDKLPGEWRRGVCIYNETYEASISDVLGQEKYKTLLESGKVTEDQKVMRSKFVVDKNLPNFSKDKNYIEKYLE